MKLEDYSELCDDGWILLKKGRKPQWWVDMASEVASGYPTTITQNEAVTLHINGVTTLPECPICGKGVTIKYGRPNKTCSRVCGGVLTQRTRHEDPEKLAHFKAACSSSAVKAWADMDIDKKTDIHRRVGDVMSERYADMTPEERRDRCNHNPNGNAETLAKFYKEICPIELEELHRKRGENNRTVMHDREGLDLYRALVWSFTERTYRKHKEIINPNGLVRSHTGWHLDHKCSIAVCYINGIIPSVAGSIDNLEMMPAYDNLIKSADCSLTPEELIRGI
ncbi:hypothetical protein VPHK397_0084 [Vibrio phage K397]